MTTPRSAEAVLDAVRDLLPVLRERAQETEDARRVPEENIKGLQDTGFFRLLQPRRYDGLEASPVDFYRGVRLISSACGSTGWVSSVLGVHPWQLGIYDDRAQREVWGDDPSTLVSSSYAPMGRATAVEGGVRRGVLRLVGGDEPAHGQRHDNISPFFEVLSERHGFFTEPARRLVVTLSPRDECSAPESPGARNRGAV